MKPTPHELRQQLLADIEEYPDEPLEVNSDALLEAFDGALLPVWCKHLNIGYHVNTKPIEEFLSKTTILFWKLDDEPDEVEHWLQMFNDSDL